jgi:biopolymer transport protein ExbD
MARKGKSRVKKHRDGDIPVGSFSDIAFLLIVYFLVATTLVKLKGVEVDMPSGQESSGASDNDKTPTVMIKGSDIYFKDKPITFEELQERLDILDLHSAEGEDKVVMLESTDETSYQDYYKVMAAISKKGGIIALVEVEE